LSLNSEFFGGWRGSDSKYRGREPEGLPLQGKNAKIKITASGSDIAAELERNLSDEWRVFK